MYNFNHLPMAKNKKERNSILIVDIICRVKQRRNQRNYLENSCLICTFIVKPEQKHLAANLDNHSNSLLCKVRFKIQQSLNFQTILKCCTLKFPRTLPRILLHSTTQIHGFNVNFKVLIYFIIFVTI